MALQLGTIKTSRYATSGKLYNKSTGALVATSTLLETIGVDATYKRLTFDSVVAGSYTLTIFVDTDEVHYDIDVTVDTTTWTVAAASGSILTEQDVQQLRYRLGIDGTTDVPTARGILDLISLTVDDVPSVVVPTGPLVRADLDAVFGSDNITIWADLNNNQNAGEIAARVLWSFNLATAEVQGYLIGSTYKWSDVEEHIVVKHLIVLRAGILLYGPRAVSDEEDKANPMRGHEKRYNELLKRVFTGNFALTDKTKQCGTIPIVVE